jgi:diacylglycerol kinase
MSPKGTASLLESFANAVSGLVYALRTQRNARVHLLFTLVVVLMALWLGLTLEHWCLLLLAMGLVWMTELSNTAIESAVDLASPQFHPLAKTAKDVKAAAVLIAALVSVLVGILLLGPPLLLKLGL